jgi:hypothetical protein
VLAHEVDHHVGAEASGQIADGLGGSGFLRRSVT